MRAAIQHGVFFVAFVATAAHSEDAPKPPPEMTALKQRYQKELEAATKPIRDRYRADLERLLRSTTQKGDFAGAQAIQNELVESPSPKPSSANSKLVGKWRFTWESDSMEVTFSEDGSFTTSRGTVGKWKIESDRVLVGYDTAHVDTMFLPLNPKGTKARSWNNATPIVATKLSP